MKFFNQKISGFSLIEVTVALSITVVVFAGLVEVTFPRLMQTGYNSKGNLMAIMQGQECMELARAKRDWNFQNGSVAFNSNLSTTTPSATTTYWTIDYDGNFVNCSTSVPTCTVASSTTALRRVANVSGNKTFMMQNTTTASETSQISLTSTTVPILRTFMTVQRFEADSYSVAYIRVYCETYWRNREYSNDYTLFEDLYDVKPGT